MRYVRAAAKVVASISATQNGQGHLKGVFETNFQLLGWKIMSSNKTQIATHGMLMLFKPS